MPDRIRIPLRTLHTAAVFAALAAACAPAIAQTPETVGRIEGDNVSVRGQVSLVREAGRNATILSSGSEVTLPAGGARLRLLDGSEMGVCGPAQFSVLKSGGATTLAVNSGRVHARLFPSTPLTFFSPLVVATPLGAGDAPREAVVGLAADGGMCVYAMRGAVRLEHQMSGASVVVPENSEIVFAGGDFDRASPSVGGCRCDALLLDYGPREQRTPHVTTTAAVVRDENEVKEVKEVEEAKEKAPPTAPMTGPVASTTKNEDAAWRVTVPLTFNAADAPLPAAAPSVPDPEIVALLRQVRVSRVATFTGRVEPRAPQATPPRAERQREERASVAGSAPGPPAAKEEKKEEGKGNPIANFFRRLFGMKAK